MRACLTALCLLTLVPAGLRAEDPSEMHMKRPRPERTFAKGPTLKDGEALLAWFQEEGSGYVRIPVVIRFSTDGLRHRELSYIGTDAEAMPEDALVLSLDDSTLGIGLDMRLRSLCDDESPTCVLWIEGFWGGMQLALMDDEGPPPWPFTVRDTAPLQGDPPTTIFVEAKLP